MGKWKHSPKTISNIREDPTTQFLTQPGSEDCGYTAKRGKVRNGIVRDSRGADSVGGPGLRLLPAPAATWCFSHSGVHGLRRGKYRRGAALQSLWGAQHRGPGRLRAARDVLHDNGAQPRAWHRWVQIG